MEIYAKAVQNGIYTRNECRQDENMPRVDGGDELTAQTNLRPVDVLRELDSADGSGVPEQTILQRVK